MKIHVLSAFTSAANAGVAVTSALNGMPVLAGLTTAAAVLMFLFALSDRK